MVTLILASASARRRDLLRQVGLSPVCKPADVDESAKQGERPVELVERLARLKVRSCAQGLQEVAANTVIIGADTVLDLDGQILGKPRSCEHFLAIMARLSDREHEVISGVAIVHQEAGLVLSTTVSTRVRFASVAAAQARSYWDSGEPADKAGGYAIQGLGAQFVEHLSGSYSNVVGLPLYETLALLKQVGVQPQAKR